MSETLSFVSFLLGLRGPRTSVTDAERDLLVRCVRGRRVVVEVGAYEGATSRALVEALEPGGTLFLVDPYEPRLKVERAFGFSCSLFVAKRALAAWPQQALFVRTTSTRAARELAPPEPPGFVFIDADHEYDAVREDFFSWGRRLPAGGELAFHDSRMCTARPDLGPGTGPVRLLEEIRAGHHGPWTVVGEADSLTVLAKPAQEEVDE